MKTNKKSRVILVTLFRIFVQVLTFVIFMAGFYPRYQGFRSLTRSLAVITASYFFVSAWMTSVYGKLDIGEKKTRPLFNTMALNLLITDGITFIAVIVMTINNRTITLGQDLLAVVIVYIAQLVVTRILIGAANDLYFSNYIPEKTLILHNNSEYLNKLLKYLNRHKKQYEIVGIIDNPKLPNLNLNEFEHIFLLDMDFEAIKSVILKTMMSNLKIYYNASISSVTLSNKETYVIDDILFFVHRTNKITLFQHAIKRAMDIVFSLLGLIVAFPFMLLVALMIKVDDQGPILFRQARVTKNGKPFEIYKFRSMKLNSELKWAEKDDDRITRAGKVIRKLRLDELPQLFNILKGDMSIVGPRPETVVLTKQFIEELPEFEYRLKVKAGLTGTAQISGKYNTTPKDKLLFDLYYIENFSTFNDLNLMFETLAVFLKKDSTEGVEAGEQRIKE